MIREAQPAGPSKETQRTLAEQAWESGRSALRADLPVLASEYFDYARSLHAQPFGDVSAAYRWCVRLLGPAAAERVGQWVWALKQKIRGRKVAGRSA